MPGGVPGRPFGTLSDFLRQVLLPRFDVVLSYDLGNGMRVEKGGEVFATWPALGETPDLPKAPRPAIETLTRYFRYCANLSRLGKPALHVACILRSAHLVVPAEGNVGGYELNALALMIRDWATEELLTQHTLVTFLVTESLNELHPLLVNNPRVPSAQGAPPCAGGSRPGAAAVRARATPPRCRLFKAASRPRRTSSPARAWRRSRACSRSRSTAARRCCRPTSPASRSSSSRTTRAV